MDKGLAEDVEVEHIFGVEHDGVFVVWILTHQGTWRCDKCRIVVNQPMSEWPLSSSSY